MKVQIKRFVSGLMVLVMLLNIPFCVHSEDIIEINVPIISTELPRENNIKFYNLGNKYYLSASDVAALTRFEIEYDGQNIEMKQGLREEKINVETGEIKSFSTQTGVVSTIIYGDKVLLEAIPVLRYLGASCDFDERGVLYVEMPWVTIWEAMMPDYENYCFDITTMYGGEMSLKIHVGLDLTADFMNAFSESFLPPSQEKRYENALMQVLSVDINSYKGTTDLIAACNQRVNDYLKSEALVAKYQEKYISAIGNELEMLGGSEEVLAETFSVIWSRERSRGIKEWENAFSQADSVGMYDAAMNNRKNVYTQAYKKASFEKVMDFQNYLEVLALSTDILCTTNALIAFDETTKKLLADTVNDRILEISNMDDLIWKPAAENVSRKLSSTSTALLETTFEKVSDKVFSEFVDMGVSALLESFCSYGNVYFLIVEMATAVSSYLLQDMYDAYSADLLAIDVGKIQEDVLTILNSFYDKAESESFSKYETLESLKKIYCLYYRMIIAFSENFACSLDEFGGKNREKWVDIFASKLDGSYSNYAAAYLYLMSNCTVKPIQKIDDKIDANVKKTFNQIKNEQLQGQEGLEKSTENKVKDNLEQSIAKQTGMFCKWYVVEDTDGDGQKEIYALVSENSDNFSNSQIWRFSSNHIRCIFWLDESQGRCVYDVLSILPSKYAAYIVEFVDEIDVFLSKNVRYLR